MKRKFLCHTPHISSDNELLFECSLDYLKTVAGSNVFNSKLKVHMWITLASGEVIDFTFFGNMAEAFPHYESMRSFIVTSPFLDELKLVYHPMIVGSDFYRKTGNMIDVVVSNQKNRI